jgi:hypothetical protein
MISRNLSRRIERLERQLRPRIKDMKASEIEPRRLTKRERRLKTEMENEAATMILRRLNQAKRRLALEGDERYAAYRNLAPEPEVHDPSLATEIVERLKAARKRMNQENEPARQNAAAAAAMEESEITKP